MKLKAIILTLFLAAILQPAMAQAKDYTIARVDFTVNLEKSGEALVTEERTYKFDGSFSWADMWINLSGKCVKAESCPDYVIDNIRVSDEKGPLRFEKTDETGRLYLKWYYSAVNTTKIFTIRYTLENAIVDHPDIREFYWQLVGNKWDKGSGEVTAKVLLPYPAPEDKIWAFGHGPLNGKVTIPTNREAVFSATNLPPKKMFEVRVLYPKSDELMPRTSSQTLQEILNEETRLGDETRQQGIIQGLGDMLLLAAAAGIGLLMISRVFYWTIRWWRIGRDKPIPSVNLAGTLHEPPSDLDPGSVETLLSWNLKPTGKAVTATIIDLIRKKVITISKEKQEPILGIFPQKDRFLLILDTKSSRTGLSVLETELIDFLFSESNILSLDSVKNIGRTKPKETKAFWEAWQKDCTKHLVDSGLLESKSYEASLKIDKEDDIYIFAAIIVGWFLIRVVDRISGFGWLLFVLVILSGIAGIVMKILRVAINKRTDTGNQELASWRAFRKYLKDYSVTKNNPIDSVILWERYLVYGAALGLSLKALAQLPVNFSAVASSSGLYAGFYGSGGGSGDFTGSFSSMFNGFSAISSGFSNFGASGVSGGGGFSGGGDVAGGGGGGGAG